MQGLCGNFDGVRNHDLVTPGEMPSNVWAEAALHSVTVTVPGEDQCPPRAEDARRTAETCSDVRT